MESTAEKLVNSFAELSSRFDARMAEFEKNLQQPSSSVPNPTVKALAAEFYAFKTFIWNSLGLLKSQVELVASGLDRLETHSRRKILLFHGVKEDKDEDASKKILTLLTSQMKLTNIKPDAIELCHRLGMKKESARPILVRFTNMQARSMVWMAKTLLKGTKTTVTEFLTKTRQGVFVAARNHFGMKKCWSADGVVVILLPDKSRVKVTSLLELKKFTTQFSKTDKN
ncbi:unnamed protein product [Euphydryas editha]|uniref:Uncharacterized protein n=1 Tax=Euphydryas editha TaxID=104508 RepID=A0AAU9TWY8_EUPED|nr:unnamed protein product [Euphydryas editha]CAH2089964.1 unnamed protein product [Euphydryas editha]